jgi:uncharacterized protein YbaR (Trm112 family)
MAIDARLLEILACPEDKGSLLYFEREGFLYNPRLQQKYRVDDGVPCMLIEESSQVGAEEHSTLMAQGVKPNFT